MESASNKRRNSPTQKTVSSTLFGRMNNAKGTVFTTIFWVITEIMYLAFAVVSIVDDTPIVVIDE